MLALTDDWAGFLKRWETPSPGFEMATVSSIRKGQPLVAALLFRGCKAGPDGKCSVWADFHVTDPQGKTYADQKSAEVWTMAPPADPQIFLSRASLGLSLDPPDSLGVYTIAARVTDRISQKSLSVRTTIEAK